MSQHRLAKILRRVFGLLALVLAGHAGGSLAAEVPLVAQGGIFTVPARVNDVLILNFVVDSGASEVQLPATIVEQLLRDGSIRQGDFLPGRTYTLADGSQAQSRRFNIRRMQLGGQVVENVSASIGSVRSPPLIGQSLLARFPAWSLDNRRQVLVLGPAAATPSPAPPGTPAPKPAAAANPFRGLGYGSPDTRDRRALRLLCSNPGARRMLDCADAP